MVLCVSKNWILLLLLIALIRCVNELWLNNGRQIVEVQLLGLQSYLQYLDWCVCVCVCVCVCACAFVYRGGRLGCSNTPLWVKNFYVVVAACQRGWRCTRIPVPHVWKIVSRFFRAGVASWPEWNVETPPLEKNYGYAYACVCVCFFV